MNCVICCIAKCENHYIKEWVDYHLKLGFSHIYIYDNNNVDGERIEEALSGYDDVVTIIDCRGKRPFQNMAYTRFYNEYTNAFDWVAYIDVDEFVTFSEESGIKTIDEFLSRFGIEVDAVHLNWMCYGDNDITELNSFNVLDRFKTPLDYNKRVQYAFPENNHVKSIIRSGLDIGDKMITVHSPKEIDMNIFDADGNPCLNDYFHPYTFKTAYIRHYVTKTLDEWIAKISRGRATLNHISELYSIERFFLYNSRTVIKENKIKLFLFYNDAIRQSLHTEQQALIKQSEYYKGLYETVEKRFNSLIKSKEYIVGKRLLTPVKWFKKNIRYRYDFFCKHFKKKN